MLKPIPGETKTEFILRYIANISRTIDTPETIQLHAEEEWNSAMSTHAGVSDGPCCKGKTLDHVFFSINLSSYNVQIKKFEGRDHIVVPVIMLTEGVHSGSDGAIYYPAAEIEKFPGAWNGVPVPVYHPEQGGFPISCNSPEVLDTQNVGRVFSAQSVEGGKKLKADLWLDVEKVKSIDPELLAKINSKQVIEVSTGLFFEADMTGGEWNGEKYYATARNFRPDHLALLPVGTGACSVMDGCGIRANETSADYEKLWRRLISNVDPSFGEIEKMIRQQVLSLMDKSATVPGSISSYAYLTQVWPTYFIYELETSNNKIKWYKQKYSLSKDKKEVLVDGLPVEVVETRVFKEVPIKSNKAGGKKVNREEIIAYLITNNFIKEAAEVEEMTDAQLTSTKASVENMLAVNAETLQTLQQENAQLKANAEKRSTPQSPEEFIAQAPADIRATLNRAMTRDRQMKKDLVEKLAKVQTVFTNADLTAKSLEELEKLAVLTSPKDFSLKGGAVPPVTLDDEEPMLVPAFNFAK